ncbi:hypothetical protein SAE02_34060 [Skermanella aerolata]|uniref:Uncharacterized protein n=1 Tax=Skermanella aerolata TaxID=393310 RepID=A0A512DRZ8_9PROT|nr:hypothetical protein SAE02_34060 [Skermanella aerolata]
MHCRLVVKLLMVLFGVVLASDTTGAIAGSDMQPESVRQPPISHPARRDRERPERLRGNKRLLDMVRSFAPVCRYME